MKKTFAILGLTAIAATTVGCSGAIRTADYYAQDTGAVLVTRSPQVKACYDAALKGDTSMAGDVVVAFTVEKKTGAFLNPQIVPERTTAPEALGQCVLSALNDLALDPPDANEGAAVFTWRFSADGAVEAVPAEAAPAEPAS